MKEENKRRKMKKEKTRRKIKDLGKRKMKEEIKKKLYETKMWTKEKLPIKLTKEMNEWWMKE